jgi:regulator of protease activity HflC (stomatin/prohibitin superfamily)
MADTTDGKTDRTLAKGVAPPPRWKRVVQWTLGGLVALMVLWSFSAAPVFTIDQGDLGVVLRFGRVAHVAQPGLNFKLPVVDRVVRMSVRNQKRTYQDLQSYSRDVQNASIRISVNYRVRPDAVAAVYADYSTDYADRIIDPIVPERLKEVFGQYQAAQVVADRVRLNQLVETAIKTSMPEGIVVESVQVENIDFSDAYEKAIEAAAQAEAEVRKSRYELDREKVEAEKRVVQAQAQAQQIRERAQADADAIRLRGEAEARAIAAKAKAFLDNPTYSTLVAVEKWNGVLPHTMLPGSALPFIQVPQNPPPAASQTAAGK